jgi:hypothetical protein
MTDFQIIEALYKKDLADRYPQYQRKLDQAAELFIVRAKRSYTVRGQLWYAKDDLMLTFGGIQTRSWAPGKEFREIYSAAIEGLALAPANHLEIVERVR